jgi:hypothetical protein
MKAFFGILLVSLLFLAGCPSDNTGGVPSGQGAGQEGASPQGGSPQGGEPQGGTPVADEPETPDEFANWDIEAMLALGQPVHCTTTYVTGSFSSTSEIFLKGENMRIESTTVSDGVATESKLIMKGNTTYLATSEGQTYGLEEDCVWVMLDFDRMAECVPESMKDETESMSSSFDFNSEDAPDEYNCGYALFGDEKFVPDGKVCDLTEQMCDAYAMMGEGGGFPQPAIDASMCAQLTGDEYTQCLSMVENYQNDMENPEE